MPASLRCQPSFACVDTAGIQLCCRADLLVPAPLPLPPPCLAVPALAQAGSGPQRKCSNKKMQENSASFKVSCPQRAHSQHLRNLSGKEGCDQDAGQA